jgi:hypothetical protein
VVRARSSIAIVETTVFCLVLACSGKSSRNELPEGAGGTNATAAGQAGTTPANHGGSGATAGGTNVGGAPLGGTSGRGGSSGGSSGSGGAPLSGAAGVSAAGAGTAGRAEGGDGGVGAVDGEAGATNTSGGVAGSGGESGAPSISCFGWQDVCGDVSRCVALDSEEHCGTCDVPAPSFAHARAVCTDEAPSPPVCQQGFADCELQSYDCETSYDSPLLGCLPLYLGSTVYAGEALVGSAALLAPSGELYVAGFMSAALDFDPGPDEDVIQPSGAAQSYVVKFAPDDSYLFARSFASPSGSSTYVRELALAPDGSLRLAGYYFDDIDLDPGDAIERRETSAENGNAFVVSISAEGDFLWGVDLPATKRSYVAQMSVDAAGNTWLAGTFEGELGGAPGVFGGTDTSGFVTKLDDAGNVGWTRVFIGDERCYADPVGLVADASGSVNALVNVTNGCELHGDTVPALQRSRETMVAVLFRFDEQGGWLSAGVLEPADASSSTNLWSAETAREGTLFAIGQLSGKSDFDPTESVDFRGAQQPTAALVRFDSAELTWMQGIRDHVNVGPVAPTPNGGALLGGFGLENMAIFGFAPDSRSMFSVGLDPKLELHALAANADSFAVVASYSDGADLDPSAGLDVGSGSGFAISRFSFTSP